MNKKEEETTTKKPEIVKPNELRILFGFEGVNSINDLVTNGIIEPVLIKERGRDVRRYDKDACTTEYIKYLRAKASRRESPHPIGAANDEARKLKADADWREAKAEIEKMKRDELNGRLHSSEDVKAVVGRLVTQIRGELLAFPGTCAMDCATARTPKEVEGILKRNVLEVLKDLEKFQYNKAEYKKRVRERTDWMNERGGEDDG